MSFGSKSPPSYGDTGAPLALLDDIGFGGNPDARPDTTDDGTTLPRAEIGFGTPASGEFEMICELRGPASDVAALKNDWNAMPTIDDTSLSWYDNRTNKKVSALREAE